MIRDLIFCLLITFFVSCNENKKEIKRACINVNVIRDEKLISVDSCFTASSQDSLDMLLERIKRRSGALQDEFDTWMMFVFADTLNKKPEEYQYALVISKAGYLDENVILTTSPDIVKQKCAAFKKENITLRKLKVGENIKGMVEDFFKHNVRINYYWEESKTVNSVN